MPQPLGDGGIEYAPSILYRERPRHAAGIGFIAAEWAALENHLISVFSFGLFALTNPEAHGVATTALWALDSQAARLQIIEDLLLPRIAPELFNYWANDLKPELRKRARERNRVVHGHWGICKSFPDDAILHDLDKKHMRYSVRDFEDIANRIIATSNQAANFTFWVQGISPAPFPVTLPIRRS